MARATLRATPRATLTPEGTEGAASSPSKSDGCGVKDDGCGVSNVGTEAILELDTRTHTRYSTCNAYSTVYQHFSAFQSCKIHNSEKR